jgi:NAD(P)-dependent dehydrogenase (short-subunit alcohol dehydrogenase family)
MGFRGNVVAPSFSLAGRVALVTGASGDLGAHFAATLAAAAARVIVAGRRSRACTTVCREIEKAGGEATPVSMDVTDARSVQAAFEAGQSRLGHIDIVVNNAGVALTTPLLETDEAAWDGVIDTNLKGAFLVSKAAAQRMRDAQRTGVIVNISSILGVRVAGQVGPYAASKAALIQLTRAMALEWARYGVRVNALCPGYIETDLNRDFFASESGQALIRRIPQRRLGRLQDLDGPLLLLCSQAGDFMTGAALSVDGGHLVSSL